MPRALAGARSRRLSRARPRSRLCSRGVTSEETDSSTRAASSSATPSGDSDTARASLSPSPSERSPSHYSPKSFARPPLVRQAGLLASRDSWARHEAQCVRCVCVRGQSARRRRSITHLGVIGRLGPDDPSDVPRESGGGHVLEDWRGPSGVTTNPTLRIAASTGLPLQEGIWPMTRRVAHAAQIGALVLALALVPAVAAKGGSGGGKPSGELRLLQP